MSAHSTAIGAQQRANMYPYKTLTRGRITRWPSFVPSLVDLKYEHFNNSLTQPFMSKVDLRYNFFADSWFLNMWLYEITIAYIVPISFVIRTVTYPLIKNSCHMLKTLFITRALFLFIIVIVLTKGLINKYMRVFTATDKWLEHVNERHEFI